MVSLYLCPENLSAVGGDGVEALAVLLFTFHLKQPKRSLREVLDLVSVMYVQIAAAAPEVPKVLKSPQRLPTALLVLLPAALVAVTLQTYSTG